MAGQRPMERLAAGSRRGRRPPVTAGPPDVDGARLDWVTVENNIRLKHWLDRLEDVHYHPAIFPHIARSARLGQVPRAATDPSLELLCCLRYLVLEAWQFTKIHDFTYRKVIGSLDVPSLGSLHGIIQSTPKIRRHLEPIRDDFVAHSTRPMAELDGEMEKVGLRDFVLYVRSIIMFQDAASALPKKTPRPELDPDSMRKMTIIVGDGHTRHLSECMSRCEGLRARVDPKGHPSIYSAMTDRAQCLNMLVLRLLRVGVRDPTTVDGQRRLIEELLNSKYMVLELDGLIEQYDRAAAECDGLAPLKPRFLENRQEYREIRNKHSGHSEVADIPGFVDLMDKRPDLFERIIRDTLEAGVMAERILPGFPAYDLHVRLLTYGELHDIERELERIRIRSRKFYEDDMRRSDHGERRAQILRRLAGALDPGGAP